MKKLLLGLAMIGYASVSVNATLIWSDEDNFTPLSNPTTVLAPGASYSDTFTISSDDGDGLNLLTPLYNPIIHSLASAEISFNLTREGLPGTYTAKASLNGTTFDTDVALTLQLQLDGTGLLDPGISATAWLALDTTGVLTYKIENISVISGKTFHINAAKLVAYQRVPDGGSTVMLLGSTLMGMAALARRKK